MQISVTTRDVELSDDARDQAVRKLTRVQRVFGRFIDMDITFAEAQGNGDERVQCDVVLHAKGQYLRATGTGADPLSAADQAEARLARQARKLKTRLVEKPRLAVDGRRPA
jgi:ribosomal subunit interface protein